MPFGGGEERQVEDRRLRPRHRRREERLELSRHARDRRGVEQVGRELPGSRDPSGPRSGRYQASPCRQQNDSPTTSASSG